jgi:ATP-dependent helicase/nuclease subunit A
MQGWIDMLLELPDGYVIIDHKSYPGSDSEEHAKQYAPQLAVYRSAIEKTTGKVIATLIHMPVIGKVFGLSKA